MQESSLHSQLKDLFTQPDDQQEAWVDGYLVDVLHRELVIEIQTRNFSAIKPKLAALLPNHPVLLVHPIAKEKWIVRQDLEGKQVRRHSPRRGRLEDVFYELIRIPGMINHPNLSFEVLLVNVEEIRRNDGKGSWRRRGWSISDRRLLQVIEKVDLSTPADFRSLLPPNLVQPFTVRDLSDQAQIPSSLAQRMVYCLRHMDVLRTVGKQGRALMFEEKLDGV